MGSAKCIGRVGGLAAALGVGIAVATAPGVAWAETDSGSSVNDPPAKSSTDKTSTNKTSTNKTSYRQMSAATSVNSSSATAAASDGPPSSGSSVGVSTSAPTSMSSTGIGATSIGSTVTEDPRGVLAQSSGEAQSTAIDSTTDVDPGDVGDRCRVARGCARVDGCGGAADGCGRTVVVIVEQPVAGSAGRRPEGRLEQQTAGGG